MQKQAYKPGQVLVGVLLIMLMLMIMVPALVEWVHQDSISAVKVSRSTSAFNLAQAAVERGYWKVKSSTATAAWAMGGNTIAGYGFDTTFTDVSGGTYRIAITSSPSVTNGIVITGEGRDPSTKEVRAITAVYQNQSIYSPALARGVLTWGPGLGIFWGPIYSAGNINLNSDIVANMYYPRKISGGAVTGTALNPRDTTYPLPPNTDNIEWWSNSQLVPELPILDFAALRSSATATGTLNVYGCNASTVHMDTHTWTMTNGPAPWDLRGAGTCTNIGAPNHNLHFAASYNHPYGTKALPNNSYVWYYDGSVILGGDTAINGTYGVGIRGSLIVRGDLTIDANGDYEYTGNVPANAWAEFSKLSKNTFDTAAVGEYPGDNGFHTSVATWKFGNTHFTLPPYGGSYFNTVGIRGFVYVGGNLIITNNGFLDINGALWVNGNTVAAGASSTSFCGIWFDENLNLPTLNVILIQQSFQESHSSNIAWN